MGNSSPSQLSAQEIIQYRRRNVTDQEINAIYGIFINFNPVNGRIKTQHVQEMYSLSYDKQKLDKKINGRHFLNFSEFYEIVYEQLVEKKTQFGEGIQFDTIEQNQPQSCFLCPASNVRG